MLFKKDRQGRRGDEVAFYVRERFDVVELNNGKDNVESIWIRIRRMASEAVIDHPTRMKKWIRYFIDSWVKSQGLYSLFSWGTSNSQTSSGYIIQQKENSPRGS